MPVAGAYNCPPLLTQLAVAGTSLCPPQVTFDPSQIWTVVTSDERKLTPATGKPIAVAGGFWSPPLLIAVAGARVRPPLI